MLTKLCTYRFIDIIGILVYAFQGVHKFKLLPYLLSILTFEMQTVWFRFEICIVVLVLHIIILKGPGVP